MTWLKSLNPYIKSSRPYLFMIALKEKIKGVKHQKKNPVVLLTHLGQPILDFATLRCGWKKKSFNILSNKCWDLMVKKIEKHWWGSQSVKKITSNKQIQDGFQKSWSIQSHLAIPWSNKGSSTMTSPDLADQGSEDLTSFKMSKTIGVLKVFLSFQVIWGVNYLKLPALE